MITQKNKKNSYVKKKVIKAAIIKYKLKKLGYKLSDISRDLNISTAAVSRAIQGKSTISRVEDWLKQKGVNEFRLG